MPLFKRDIDNKLVKFSSMTVLAFSLAACQSLPSSDDEPANVNSLAASEVQTEKAQWQSAPITGEATSLTELIDDKSLTALIEQGISANPDLQQVLLTLKIRRAQLNQADDSLLPTLDASFKANNDEGKNNTYTGGLTVSWEADLWSQIADGNKATAKAFSSQQALYQASLDSLVAQVMSAWLGVIAQSRALKVEEDRVELLAKNESLLLNRYKNGNGDLEGLDGARSSLSSAKEKVEQYREDLAINQRSLMRLLGYSKIEDIQMPTDYPKVLIPLAQLPEQTLARRPDLMSAFYDIEQADLEVQVAYKDLLPSLSLSASLTDVAYSPSAALFTSPVWGLLGQLTIPLFQQGKLDLAIDVAKYEAAQSYQVYRAALLDAVFEVENAISLEKSLNLRQTHLEDALTAEKNNLLQYQKNFKNGSVDIVDLLGVQQDVFNLIASLDDLIYQRLDNRITLGLALGLSGQVTNTQDKDQNTRDTLSASNGVSP
ncbi:TolC family protein [Marinomonas sp. PE14-40]|uniref:TolC family protein n=1 Tax=Marinomonas sp. PE14-40 TaxID=3060621 RepID=UPI003F6625D9